MAKQNIPTKPQQQAIQQAMKLHEAGKLDEAYAAYQSVLKSRPADLDALLNLSTLHSQRGELEEAATLLKKLVPLTPKLAYPQFAYGNVLMKLKRHHDALAAFTRALNVEPKNAAYHYNQGVAYDALEKFEDALDSYARAIEYQPTHTQALINRANDLFRKARYEEAIEACNQVIAQDANIPLAYTTRGNAYGGMGNTTAALADYERAIALDPNSEVAHNNRGNLLKGGQDAEHAIASYDHAISLNANYADAHNNRGTVLNKLERYEEALKSADTAIAIDPNSAVGHDTRANALTGLRRYDEAIAAYDRSLEIDPKQVNSYWNKTMLVLLLGDLEQGYRLYEHRWRTEFQKTSYRAMEAPLWLGQESLAGKTILIHVEQGFGDFIQFARYIPLLEQQGAKVIVETLGPLIPLLQPCIGSANVTFIEHKSAPLPHDFHCPIMSLPHAFKTTLETIPSRIPYLWPSQEKKAEWAARLGPQGQPRIGLVWSGAAAHLDDHNRSLTLATLAPLLALPFEFHSLQKEVRPRDEAYMLRLRNHARHLNDFSDTGALADAMDLCITVDTSIAHLVGALGKSLWVMLPFAPDYRWLLHRSDSPWYPTATLFRQPVRGDWPAVVNEMTGLLKTVFGA